MNDGEPRVEQGPFSPSASLVESGDTAAPSATPVPPAVSAAAIPSAAPPAVEAIEAVLSGYVKAFNTLDVRAAKAVWPKVDERALSRAFEALEKQQFALGSCQIDVKGVLAVAACGGTAQYVPKIGSRSVRSERRQWTFYLGHRGDEWAIETVQAR